jgi:hypothetical protein
MAVGALPANPGVGQRSQIQGIEMVVRQKNTDQKPHIAHPVHQKGLLSSPTRGRPFGIKANKQV